MCPGALNPGSKALTISCTCLPLLSQVRQLSEQGVREITLLGQNVNSYNDASEVPRATAAAAATVGAEDPFGAYAEVTP